MADFTQKDTQLPFLGQVAPRTNKDLGALITLTAAGAGTTDSDDQVNASSRGLMVTINVSAKTGTIDLVVSIQRKDPASGVYTTLLSSASITTVSTTTLIVTPDIAASANAIAQTFLGENWRIRAVSGTGSSPVITATISACLLP